MDKSNWLRDWWMGLVNDIDSALVNWVFKRRGPSFIFYFTNPEAWEDYMGWPTLEPLTNPEHSTEEY